MGQETKGLPVWTRHVDGLFPAKDGISDLIESGRAVQATLDSPGFRIIGRLVAAEVEFIDRRLDGPALEQAEYARLHGRRAALQGLEDAARAVVARAVLRTQQANERQAAGETVAGR